MAPAIGTIASMSVRGYGMFTGATDFWANKPVIAVIDETSASSTFISQAWTSFRTQFPKRKFYLLWPSTGTNAVTALQIPSSFYNVGQGYGTITFGPNSNSYTGQFRVNRDLGNPSNASDWFDICDLDTLSGSDRNVTLWVDGSGSMTPSTVAASINLLVTNMSAAGIPFVTNPLTPSLVYWSVDLNSTSGYDEVWPIPYVRANNSSPWYAPGNYTRPWGTVNSSPGTPQSPY